MMKIRLLFLLVLAPLATFAQVGIGTIDPLTNLEVAGTPADNTIADGITIPRLTGDELSAKNINGLYTTLHEGTVVYITVAATTPDRIELTENVTSAGLFYFDGVTWQRFAVITNKEHKVVYSAEYAGAALQADGIDNSLVLNATNSGAPIFLNYYEASNFNVDGGTNDFNVVLRIALPQDFTSWSTTTDAIVIDFEGTTDASFEADVYEEGNTTSIQDNATVSGTGLTGFVENTIATNTQLNSLIAGDTLIIVIKLTVTDVATQNTSVIRIGDVTLNYNKT